ncbi:MAG: amidohydrolase [Gemmatimonadaceae bacterium]|nr:amidohydrolase [Gemmatimonadaceae bacterium]
MSLFVHHMMDMDNHYPPGRSLYPFVTLQMRRIRILAQRAGGRLLGFVAYDPFREADKGENEAVAVVERALKSGFAGVKFYPPSGYKPLGNTKKDMSRSGKDPSRINAVNERLFKLCVDLDAPVFAHCSPGEMERWKGAGLFADPKYWRKVLEQPRFNNLRLCLAHAGGDAGWCAKPGLPVDPDFVPEVVRLCQTYPNVYCEFGHTEQLFVESNRPYFARRLADAVTATGVRYDFGTKIMYGSDWHLLARTPDVEDFDDVFRKIFRGNQTLAKYEHQFFGLNALRYLNLADFLSRNSGSLTRQEFEYLSFLAAP